MASRGSVRDDLVRLVHRGLGGHEFAERATQALARAVAFDGACVLLVDPVTQMPSGEVVQHGLPDASMARLAEIELSGRDVNSFAALARTDRRAASLSTATSGALMESQRHRELRDPHGWGDELRAALVSGQAMRGGLTLNRSHDRPAFTPAEIALVATASDLLAEGLRRAALSVASSSGPHPGIGLLVLDPDGTVAATDAAAETWLAQLRESSPRGTLPAAVAAVAVQARRIASGQAAFDSVARCRLRTASGHWLVLHATTIGEGPDATTAVIVEPASTRDVAPLLADAYGLSERECMVSRLVARGLLTDAIARELHLSPWTVQDHLKAIFGKVGVNGRGELVARLYLADGPADLTG